MQFIQNANKGLFTNYNEFSNDTPQGSMTIAKNIVIDKTNVAEPRRGFSKGNAFDTATDRHANLFYFDDKIISHKNTGKLAYLDEGSWTEYTGTYVAADVALGRLKHATAIQNIYFATTSGIKKLADYTGAIESAGIPKALDGQAALTAVASGFLAGSGDGETVAYRVIWGKRDANNNLILGAPSQRIIISNTTGASEDVVLTITIPDSITTSDFYQVYRSANYAATVTPNDELLLVYEDNPDSTDITNGYLSFTDSTPESLRGATLYTSPSQEGIVKANNEPPLAKDLALFSNYMFYANTQGKQNKTITYIGGLANDKTITINGVVYTAKAAESVGDDYFKLYTTGSVFQNIADTAKSLCKIINRSTNNTTIYAYYISSVDDLPGKIYLESIDFGTDAFPIISNSGSSFNPVLPASGTTVSSSNDTNKNFLYYSKYEEPEAVPALNYFPVGTAATEIIRIVPLKESLLIFKEDSVYRLTGDSDATFYIDQLDATTSLLAPDSAVALNNQVYGLFDQGICAVSDTGVSIRSRPIEDKILDVFGASLTNLKKYSFGLAYDSDRKYILFTIQRSADTYSTQCFVFNYITNAWTEWVLEKNCGLVHPTEDKLYLGPVDDQYLQEERKTYTFRDFVDDELSRNASDVSGNTMTIDNISNVEVGDLYYETSSRFSVISEVNKRSNLITLSETLPYVGGVISIFKSINADLEYNPIACGNAAMLKQTRELHVLFKEKFFYTGKIGFTSNINSQTKFVTISGGASDYPWGFFEWGGVAWGGELLPNFIRTYVPREQQRNTWLKIRINIFSAYCQFGIDGVSLVYKECSPKAYK